jgi:hypothetical protein
VALVGAAYNRNGAPESQVVFSEREMTLPYDWGMQHENSGIALHLQWRAVRDKPDAYDFFAYQPLPWLNAAKLRELGFDLPVQADTPANRRHYDKLQAREVLLLMELDGPAYQASLVQVRDWVAQQQALAARNPGNADLQERTKRASEKLRAEERTASRLFLVDAGLDVGALRARYPDRSRYVIVRGRIKPQLRIEGQAPRVEGVVQSLSINEVQVPEPYRQILMPLLRQQRAGAGNPDPRYSVTVAFGRRLEPWVVNASAPQPSGP